MKLITLIFLLFIGCFDAKHLNGNVQFQSIPATVSRAKYISNDKEINSRSINGIPRLPGLEIRINPRGFTHASLLAGLIIDQEIRRIHLPSLKQCFKQFRGCITAENFTISRYRCPQLVSSYPKPPNRLILNVQNLDLEIKANVNGEIEELLPMKINNTVYMHFNQVSATIPFTVSRKLDGTPYVRINDCYVSVGSNDVIFQSSDYLGDIFNSIFQGNMKERIRKQFPIKVCQMIGDFVEKKINLPLATMPKVIPLINFTNFAKQTISSIKLNKFPKHCYTALCKEKIEKRKTITHFSSPKTNSLVSPAVFDISPTVSDVSPTVSDTPPTVSDIKRHTFGVNNSKISNQNSGIATLPIPSMSNRNIRQINTSTSIDPCADCYSHNFAASIDDLSNLKKFIEILPGIVLDMHLVKAFATPDYFQIGLRAAFRGEKITDIPFYPFLAHFPEVDNGSEKQMMDVLISDYTINTFLYQIHENGIFMFRIGPETPKIGSLLKTTCSNDDYDDFNDIDFEDDEEFVNERNSTKFTTKRQKRQSSNDDTIDANDSNAKGDDDIFSDLGICLGDIMPAIREKYPNKLIDIKLYSKRTPYLTLLAKDAGIARIDLELEIALYIDDSEEKFGTVHIISTIDGNIKISDKKIFVLIKIQSLKLIDRDQTLGLPPDALENLANLAKDIIAQTANNELAKGITIQLIAEKLPYNLVKPKISIIDHAVHVSTDFNIPANILGIKSSTICRRF